MKTTRQFLLAILTFTTLFGCSFGNNNTSENKAEIEERNRLNDQFALITGRYEGTIRSQIPQSIQLAIYTVEVRDGQNSDGAPRFRPQLKALYRRLNSTQPDVVMDVRFTAETGDVSMANSPGATPGGGGGGGASVKQDASGGGGGKAVARADAPNISIRGRLIGENITGSVSNAGNGGAIGPIELHRVSRDSSAPPEGDIEERNERLRRLYAPLLGKYTGRTTFSAGDPLVLNFYLTVYIADETEPSGTTIPTLVAFYQRHDDPNRNVTLLFDCTYNPDVNPPLITMISRPYPGPPNSYKLSVNARVKGNTIVGTMTDYYKGRTGTMSIQKMKQAETGKK